MGPHQFTFYQFQALALTSLQAIRARLKCFSPFFDLLYHLSPPASLGRGLIFLTLTVTKGSHRDTKKRLARVSDFRREACFFFSAPVRMTSHDLLFRFWTDSSIARAATNRIAPSLHIWIREKTKQNVALWWSRLFKESADDKAQVTSGSSLPIISHYLTAAWTTFAMTSVLWHVSQLLPPGSGKKTDNYQGVWTVQEGSETPVWLTEGMYPFSGDQSEGMMGNTKNGKRWGWHCGFGKTLYWTNPCPCFIHNFSLRLVIVNSYLIRDCTTQPAEDAVN